MTIYFVIKLFHNNQVEPCVERILLARIHKSLRRSDLHFSAETSVNWTLWDQIIFILTFHKVQIQFCNQVLCELCF